MKSQSFNIRPMCIACLQFVFIIGSGLLSSCAQSQASESKNSGAPEMVSLDGQQFMVSASETGKPETAVTEFVSFQDGKFFSPDCAAYGFQAAPYKAWKENGLVSFEITLASPSEGIMMYSGTISQNILSGKGIWKKEGQPDISYDLSSAAGLLDGKIFSVTNTDPGSGAVDTEEITFSNGYLESPSCYQYGFSKAPYTSSATDGSIKFQSLYTSEKEGKMTFEGLVKGKELTGTLVWEKSGQASITYQMKGTLIK